MANKRYNIEFKKDGKTFSRETDAKSIEETNEKIKKFGIKDAEATEILYSEKTDIVK